MLDFFETICNVTMYQKAMIQENIDLELLPISSLKRDILLKAELILNEIDYVITNEISSIKLKTSSFDNIEA